MKTPDLKKLLDQRFGHLSDDRLLALTIYGEARGESREGKIAMASVVLERVEHRNWDGRTVKEVCLMPWQFSCFLPGDPNFPQLARIAEDFDAALGKSAALVICHDIARGVLDGRIPRDPIVAATHAVQYCTVDCRPKWAAKMREVAQIGRHIFYAEAGGNQSWKSA